MLKEGRTRASWSALGVRGNTRQKSGSQQTDGMILFRIVHTRTISLRKVWCRLLTVNGTFRAAARFCSARQCPRPWPPEGQMGLM